MHAFTANDKAYGPWLTPLLMQIATKSIETTKRVLWMRQQATSHHVTSPRGTSKPATPRLDVNVFAILVTFFSVAVFLSTGCSNGSWFHGPKNYGFIQRFGMAVPNVPLDGSATVTNPVPLADQDPEFIWLQIVDTVDDYFRIKTEQRFERSAQRWQEGRVETYPEIGSTYLENWRKDALPGFQRLQSTFQTIRRTCNIKVTPMTTGYSMSVEVIKELEDVDRSASSGEGSAAVRHDGGIVRADAELIGQPITLGWIRQENDTELEQRILREVLGRVSEVKLPRRKLIPHD